MSNDLIELPTRKIAARESAGSVRGNGGLIERQKDMAIEAVARTVDGAVSIARDIVEIAHVRAVAQADVARIDAETRAVMAWLKGEVERIIAQGETVRKRGEAAAVVIAAVLAHIPDSDPAARAAAVDNLHQLVSLVINKVEPTP